MSILKSEDEDQFVLEDVFALIDSCEQVTCESCQLRNSVTDKCIDEAASDDSKLKKKRIRRPETSSTAFQRKRKAEVLALREEAASLEARLLEIKLESKQSCSKDAVNEPQMQCNWYEKAADEYHERLRSEELNVKLRVNLDEQVRINGDILATLRNRFITLGRGCFDCDSAAAPDDFVSIDSAIARLERRAQRLDQKRADICKHLQTKTSASPICL